MSLSEEDISKYYASRVAQQPMDMAGVYVNMPGASLADALKGKGLYATRDVEEGEQLFCERKLVGCAMKESVRLVESCEYCMRPLGTVEEAFQRMGKMKVLKGKPDNSDLTFGMLQTELPYKEFVGEVAALRAERFAEEQAEADFVVRNEGHSDWPLPDGQWECGRVPCVYHSGAQFCSVGCRDRAMAEYLCVFVDSHAGTNIEEAVLEDEDDEKVTEEHCTAHTHSPSTTVVSTQAAFQALQKYCRVTNPTLYIAATALARITVSFARELLVCVEEPELDLVTFNPRDAGLLMPCTADINTVRASAVIAMQNAMQPFQLFSQAPWELQTSHLHIGVAANMGEQQRTMLESTVDMVKPLLDQYLTKLDVIIQAKVGACLDLVTVAPAEGVVLSSEEALMAYVNDVTARQAWSSSIYSPAQLLSTFFVSCLMGAFEMNNFGTTARTPVRDYLECCTTAGDPEDLADLLALAREVAQRPQWEDSPLHAATASVKTFKGFLATAEKVIHKKMGARRTKALERRMHAVPEGSGLFAVACCMNHSCSPNVMAGKLGDGRDDLTAFIALEPIKAGEELLVSYIDEMDMNQSERAQALQDYLFVCQCKRCK